MRGEGYKNLVLPLLLIGFFDLSKPISRHQSGSDKQGHIILLYGVWPAYVSVYHVHAMPMEARGQHWTPLELELHTLIICHAVDGNPTGVLWKISQSSFY